MSNASAAGRILIRRSGLLRNCVFVLSVSPVKKNVDPLTKELVSAFKLAARNLDAEEAKRLSSEAIVQR